MLMGIVPCQTSHTIYSDVTYKTVMLDRLTRLLCKIGYIDDFGVLFPIRSL
jgi:hypothetical protein